MTSRAGYWIGGILAFAAIAAGIVVAVLGITSTLDDVEGWHRVEVPGEATFDLDATGHTVYLEHRSEIDGRRIRGDDRRAGAFRDLVVTGPDGDEVPLDLYGADVNYSLTGYAGRAILTFEPAEAGPHTVRTLATDGSTRVIAIGEGGFGRGIVGGLLGGLAVIVVGGAVGAALVIVTAVRRRRQRRENDPWGLQPPPPPPPSTGWTPAPPPP